jgi:aminopeptidase N
MAATQFTRAALDFADGDKAWALAQDQLSSTHPIASDAKDTLEADQNFDGITYAKGAAVLRQLLAWLGDDVVFGGLKEYFQTYEWSNATLNDLLTVWQKHAGPDRDVFRWAELWLTTTGANTLTGQRVDGQGNPGFSILQSPAGDPPQLRPHRVIVGAYRLENGALVRAKRVAVDVEDALTDVPELAGEKFDLILVNDEDLTYAKVRLDPRSLQAAVDHVGKIEDPLARMLVWSSAWDMLRDAEMPARQYAAMVEHNIRDELDPDNASGRLGNAMSAIGAYGDQANYGAAMSQLADLAREMMEAAEPGSLMQLAMAKDFIGAAETKAQNEYIRDLYTGAKVIAGLDVEGNVDLRWQMVTNLAEAGLATAAMVDAEAAKDPTNFGADRALTAKAARPRPDVKEAAWRRILDDRTLSLKSYQAIVGGFASVDRAHDHLLDKYIDKYVQALPEVWKERSVEEAEAFTGALFPRYRGRAHILALSKQLAKRTDLPAPARRQLAEIRDDIVRQAKAQALDRQCAGNGRGVA